MILNKIEFKFKNELLYVYNYEKIKKMKSNLIVIDNNNYILTIKGPNIIIKELYKEYIVISGNITDILILKEDINGRS